MLLNRFRICFLIGLPWIVGCSGSSGEYRPLTETPAESATATETLSAPDSSALSHSGKNEQGDSRSGSRADAAESKSGSISHDGAAAAKTGPVETASTGSTEPTPGVAASESNSPSEKPISPDRGDMKTEETPKPVKAIAGMSSSPRNLTAEEKNLIPGGNRGVLSPLAKASAKPLEIKLLIPQKEFVREGKSQSWRITFDDLDLLKVCNMEPVPPDVMDHLPDWLKNLNGQKIILRGWMFPSGRQEGISSFMFVRDNGICCFGRGPKVYDKLAVTMQPGKTTKYIAGRPFDVEATLFIEPDIEGTEEGLWWLYRLENARVIDQ